MLFFSVSYSKSGSRELMKGVKELKAALVLAWVWPGSRLDFTPKFILALFMVKTVNLAQMATAFPGRARWTLYSKRLQRFFRGFSLDYTVLAKVVTNLLPIREEAWVLTLDRTNWKFGRVNITSSWLG